MQETLNPGRVGGSNTADHGAEVVDGGQAIVEEFATFEEMMEICAGEIGAGGTIAGGINGLFI